ncbi:MAG: response regulator [Chloroflexi bacterium]|nr:response regulator [Chloroflexota bacterium]
MTNERISVLVVDDEPDMLWALGHILSRSGYGVVTASNASRALDCLKEQDFALAFIDVKLSDMDGLQLATTIREMNLSVGIIMISGYYYANDAEIEQEFAQRPYIGFIAKPFNLADIRNIVHKALTNREDLSMTPLQKG